MRCGRDEDGHDLIGHARGLGKDDGCQFRLYGVHLDILEDCVGHFLVRIMTLTGSGRKDIILQS